MASPDGDSFAGAPADGGDFVVFAVAVAAAFDSMVVVKIQVQAAVAVAGDAMAQHP